MRKFYTTIMMLAMMVVALTFTACGDDEDADGINSSALIGTWEPTTSEGWINEIPDEYFVETYASYLQFKSDHTYIDVTDDAESGVEITKGEWYLSNNRLTMKETEGDMPGFTWTSTIIKLEKDKMEISTLGSTFHMRKVSDSKIQKYLK